MALTSHIEHIRIVDSSSPTGEGLAGKVFGDFTIKLLPKNGVLSAALTTQSITTLGTYEVPTSNAHIRIKEVNAADPTKGLYEVHFHNDQVAGNERTTMFISVAGGSVDPLEIDLTNITGRLPAALDGNGDIKAGVQTIAAAALTAIAGAVWNALTATYVLAGSFGKFLQDRIDVVLSTRAATGAQMDLVNAPNLTASHSIATIVESHLLDEGDSQLLINAIVGAIGNQNVDEVALVALIRSDLERNNGLMDIIRDRLRNYIQLITRNDVNIANDLAAIVADINSSEGSGVGNWNPVGNVGNGSLQSLNGIAGNIQAILNDTGGIDGVKLSGDAIEAIHTKNYDGVTFPPFAFGDYIQAIRTLTNKLETMLQSVGPNYQYTGEALENAGGGGGIPGPGASPNVITITSNAIPVADADVWISLDNAGTNIVAGTLQTDSMGNVTFLLDPGVTYYVWMQKNGENPILGSPFVAT